MTDFLNGESSSFFPQEEEKPQNAPDGNGRRLSVSPTVKTIFDYVELVVVTVCIILLVTLFMFRHAVVEGSSMETTLSNGEHLMITDLFYDPQRNDIVVFESEGTTGKDKPLIKRVIATAGETVIIDQAGVWVNGNLVSDDASTFASTEACYYTGYLETVRARRVSGDGSHYYEYTVGEHEIFVMGDNRSVGGSYDSRAFGAVDVDSVLGHVVLRMYPFSKLWGVD